ncbi:MAG: pyridoxal-phosphate dependent enzyme [Treponema sp.]|nr:pyridoxal-phosphate dependent enzyme [Treponema sp.]
MLFTSTRNKDLSVKFSKAVRDCIPEEGGVFVPSVIEDMRRWTYYINEKTSFTSIAGSLTSGLINDEYSPIICETIATNAFPFEPKVRQLDSNLFVMELYHGFTGYHRDFGVSYLCSYLEYTLQLSGGKAIFLDFTHGGLGSLLAKVLRGKKNLKAVLVYKKGSVRGLKDEDLVWNGGNIYPVEMEGSEEEIKAAIAQLFADRDFVAAHNLTVANTTNVCRLLGQIFLFPYAFAQIKNKIGGDIYYALDSGNYGTLIAGLYSWRFALPLKGFLVPSTPALTVDVSGNPIVLDSMVNLKDRDMANPVIPANIERLESFFGKNKLMMRNFVYPVEVSERMREKAAKELFMKYGLFADEATARAYACIKAQDSELFDDDSCFVLMAYNHPSLSEEYCRHVLGESPEMPENIKAGMKNYELNRPLVADSAQLKKIIESLN